MTEEQQPLEPTAEVVEVEPAEAALPTRLWNSNDPVQVLAQAQRTADALMDMVRQRKLTVAIQGKQYMLFEGWQALGQMLGVTAVIDWTHPLKDPDGWEARAEARTLDGRVIGAAEAECLRDEGQWAKTDRYALRSMAQTRASSKALASVLRFVAVLGGLQGTPADEVPPGGFESASGGDRAAPSTKQLDFLDSLLKRADVNGTDRQLLGAYAAENLTGGRGGSMSSAIDLLKDNPDEYLPRMREAADKWAANYSDLPAPDTSDLPEVEDVGQ